MATAGTSIIPPLLSDAARVLGSVIPAEGRTPLKVPDHPEATALTATKYSAVKHQAIIIAVNSQKAI